MDYSGIKVCLAVTANHDQIGRDFMMHLFQLYRPMDWIVSLKGQHIKSASLNDHLAEASNANCTHILFMDVDMQFPAGALVRLLEHELPIVSGLYHLKEDPFSPIAGWTDKEGMAINGNGNMWKEEYCPLPDNSLVEVHWCGIGCLLVDMKVFDKIYFPPFYDKWNHEKGIRQKGHDVILCEELRKAGYKIFVDTSVDCTHIARAFIDKTYVETYHRLNMTEELEKTIQGYSVESPYWDEVWTLHDAMGKCREIRPWMEHVGGKIPEGSSVIELGCGDGNACHVLKAGRGCDVYGIDFSRKSIEMLSARGIPGEVADIRTYEANGRKAETVLMAHTMEHMPDDKLDRVAKLISDMCTEQAFVVVPMSAATWYEHLQYFTPESLSAVLEPHFDSVEIIKAKSIESVMIKIPEYRHLIAWCKKKRGVICEEAAGADEVSAAVIG